MSSVLNVPKSSAPAPWAGGGTPLVDQVGAQHVVTIRSMMGT